jgi:C4-dicarboxylate transporter DctM subunit
MMVIYGSIANVSIAKLFLGGIVPGILIGLSLMVVAYLIAVRRGYSAAPRAGLREIATSARSAAAALGMPVIVLGGMFGGVFTATEAGAVAVVYALAIGLFLYRTLDARKIVHSLVEASVMSAAAMLVIALSTGFAWLLAWDGFAARVSEALLAVSSNPIVVMLLIVIVIQIIGLFVDGIPVLVIMTPVLLPAVTQLGIDPIHFGVVMVMSCVIGSVTPPVGVLIFIGCSIARATMSEVFWILWPFCGALFAVLLLAALYPPLVMTIPQLFR